MLDTVNQFCATLHVDASLHFSLARWDAFRTVFTEQHEFAAFYRAPLRTSPMMRHVAPQELVQQLGDKNWLQCGGCALPANLVTAALRACLCAVEMKWRCTGTGQASRLALGKTLSRTGAGCRIWI